MRAVGTYHARAARIWHGPGAVPLKLSDLFSASLWFKAIHRGRELLCAGMVFTVEHMHAWM